MRLVFGVQWIASESPNAAEWNTVAPSYKVEGRLRNLPYLLCCGIHPLPKRHSIVTFVCRWQAERSCWLKC